ncbi:DUF3429 domain-containing protein [Acuticoccus sp. MNP-M23]|uniref:DUF3429 domain-containing protein n=1 Tax=Acuticoccus sp. MNP-M23 TaxID=3072793 RepID=UPI002814A470|nr:DUF3429 domain-containing protein [Acuticoccus sp. MNP-M23]WMS40839.1 DUF3429 domain-containing protein [Acuticoccus sp. MNP-M23]
MSRPILPIAIGLSGLLPFIAAAVGVAVLPPFLQPIAFYTALVYGLAILCFLGGVHWGIALQGGSGARYIWSVVSPLLGFVAVFAPRPVALFALAGAFIMIGIVDIAIFRRTGPRWYAGLRAVLTLVVSVCLIFVASQAGDLRVDPFGSIVRPA